ncbi:MAG: hypothetical protein Q4G66_11015 [bacterium]|nr:hypothetical protein [bacterium]
MEEQILRFSEMRYIPILEHGNDVPLELEFVIRGEVVLGANTLADSVPTLEHGNDVQI